jgi:hypothetical protein
MHFSSVLKTTLFAAGLLAVAPCLSAQKEVPGLPPRATPGDYPSQTQVGAVTIAAEFKGHSVPTSEGTLTTSDYIVVEAAFFGPPDSRLKLSVDDFSIRVNGKKVSLPAQPFGMVFHSLKDPELEPPASAKNKTNVNSGGAGAGGGQGDPPPTPPKVPFETIRSQQQRTQKASMAEGDRLLPQAGLIYFPYTGKAEKIQKLELTYEGPAGKATFALQP